ncbi:hypothetical protein [Mycobacterium interjectum]|uniref:hypothetical protein n=1 Tax=Mycobacterium interjectum TaxID=33895 RepID=UPI00083003C0|nr:hypothetical protein [Mycobacterium interjectum]MCV7090026.1 hypothetical protein [Mycobacterium interjectum]
MSTNGQRPAAPTVSFNDPVVVGRMVAIAVVEGDRQAFDDIAERRPDLDVRQLELTAAIVCAIIDAWAKRGVAP